MNGNAQFYLGGVVTIYAHLFQLCWVPLDVVNLRNPPGYK